MSRDDGLDAAAQLALQRQPDRPATPPEQLDLLGMPAYRNSEGREVVPRAGRPPGSRNRRTQEWIDYLLARYPSPLEGLLAMGNVGIDEISRSLQCTKLEAAQVKIRCLEASLPFLHPRLSSIEIRPKGDPDGAEPSTLTIDAVELAPEDSQ